MEGEELAEPPAAERRAERPLDQVDIGPAIAFNQPRPVTENGDIPADDHPIAEGGMCASNQIKDIVPERQGSAGNRRASIGMTVNPAETGIHSDIGCPAQRATSKVDGSRQSAGMHIIDGDIAANRQPQYRANHLWPLRLVKAADDADSVERPVAETGDIRMIADPLLDQIGLAQRHPAQSFEKLRRGKSLALDMAV